MINQRIDQKTKGKEAPDRSQRTTDTLNDVRSSPQWSVQEGRVQHDGKEERRQCSVEEPRSSSFLAHDCRIRYGPRVVGRDR